MPRPGDDVDHARENHHIEGAIIKRKISTIGLDRLELNTEITGIGTQRGERLS